MCPCEWRAQTKRDESWTAFTTPLQKRSGAKRQGGFQDIILEPPAGRPFKVASLILSDLASTPSLDPRGTLKRSAA